MNRDTQKDDLKITLQKWYKNVHQGQGPAVVLGSCDNEHKNKEYLDTIRPPHFLHYYNIPAII